MYKELKHILALLLLLASTGILLGSSRFAGLYSGKEGLYQDLKFWGIPVKVCGGTDYAVDPDYRDDYIFWGIPKDIVVNLK